MTDEIIPIPKWLQISYARLLRKFRDKKFNLSEARVCLHPHLKKSVNIIIHDLRSAGWLVAHLNKDDIRKFKYELVQPNYVFRKMADSLPGSHKK